MTLVKDDDGRTCQNVSLKFKNVVVVVVVVVYFLKTAMSKSLPNLLQDIGKIETTLPAEELSITSTHTRQKRD